MKVCYIITIVCACLAALTLIAGVANANGAPQEASAAAIAIGLVVIPYVFSRSVEKLSNSKKPS